MAYSKWNLVKKSPHRERSVPGEHAQGLDGELGKEGQKDEKQDIGPILPLHEQPQHGDDQIRPHQHEQVPQVRIEPLQRQQIRPKVAGIGALAPKERQTEGPPGSVEHQPEQQEQHDGQEGGPIEPLRVEGPFFSQKQRAGKQQEHGHPRPAQVVEQVPHGEGGSLIPDHRDHGHMDEQDHRDGHDADDVVFQCPWFHRLPL